MAFSRIEKSVRCSKSISERLYGITKRFGFLGDLQFFILCNASNFIQCANVTFNDSNAKVADYFYEWHILQNILENNNLKEEKV